MDMLVKLYDLPAIAPALQRCADAGVDIRRAIGAEKHRITAWAREHFSEGWASEIDIAHSHLPLSCFVATENQELIGFAVYDAGFRGIFGPTGVSESARGKGVGAALLLACLHDMRSQGYVYAVIGWTGPQEFYTKVCGATVIPGSRPGGYRGMLGLPVEE